MAKIKNIQVKVTYSVGLGGLNVPKKVMEQLNEIVDKSHTVEFGDLKYPEASDWIQNNIKERDCFQSSFEIDDLE